MPLFGLFGPPDIEKLKAKRDVQGLIKAMSYKNEDTAKEVTVVYAAAFTLASLAQSGDTQAMDALIAVANGNDYLAREAALKKLGVLRDARAVEPLLANLKRDPYDLSVIKALGQIRDARAVEPLLVQLDARRYDTPETHSVEIIEALKTIGDARAVKSLIVALKDHRPEVRFAAIEALKKMGDVCAVEPLIAVLNDQDYKVRSAAVIALGSLRDARAVEPLIAILTHINDATEALAMIGEPALPALVAALKNTDYSVVKSVVKILKRIGWQPTTDIERASMFGLTPV